MSVEKRDRSTACPANEYLPLNGSNSQHVGFSPTRQTLLAPSAKRREVFGVPREG